MGRESAIQGRDVRDLIHEGRKNKSGTSIEGFECNQLVLSKKLKLSFCFSKRACIYCKPEKLTKLLDDKMTCEISNVA